MFTNYFSSNKCMARLICNLIAHQLLKVLFQRSFLDPQSPITQSLFQISTIISNMTQQNNLFRLFLFINFICLQIPHKSDEKTTITELMVLEEGNPNKSPFRSSLKVVVGDRLDWQMLYPQYFFSKQNMHHLCYNGSFM